MFETVGGYSTNLKFTYAPIESRLAIQVVRGMVQIREDVREFGRVYSTHRGACLRSWKVHERCTSKKGDIRDIAWMCVGGGVGGGVKSPVCASTEGLGKGALGGKTFPRNLQSSLPASALTGEVSEESCTRQSHNCAMLENGHRFKDYLYM